MQFTNTIGYFIRKTGLTALADRLRYYVQKFINYRKNNSFINKNPQLILPPDYFIYETYTLDYDAYIQDGRETAREIMALVNEYANLNAPGNRVLDWGCGPARIIRHFPSLSENKMQAFGSDYNSAYIEWNKKNIGDVTFLKNELKPPIEIPDNYFAVIFGLSVLTHLSEENQKEWIKEMHRILNHGGLLILTSQGDAFKTKLTGHEQKSYLEGRGVHRINKNEGGRTFSSFQPEIYMKELLADFKLLSYKQGGLSTTIHGSQDTWIVTKL
ncbi:MAG: class I SAM-dependent methyltransferase [Ginsengibacter sp.]